MTAAQHAFAKAAALLILRAGLRALDLIKLSPTLTAAESAGITLVREGVDFLEDRIEPDAEDAVAAPVSLTGMSAALDPRTGPPIPPPMPAALRFPPTQSTKPTP